MTPNTAQAAPKAVAAAPPRIPLSEELLWREADAEVDRQARLHGYTNDLMRVFAKEKAKLEIKLPALRAQLGQAVEKWEKRFDRLGGAKPSASPLQAKWEKRLVVLEACMSILRDKIEEKAKEHAEEHKRAEVSRARAEENRLLASFRKEEAEKARQEEYKRFLVWKEKLGL